MEDDGKAADQDVANAFGIQSFAEVEEVFELDTEDWLARLSYGR